MAAAAELRRVEAAPQPAFGHPPLEVGLPAAVAQRVGEEVDRRVLLGRLAPVHVLARPEGAPHRPHGKVHDLAVVVAPGDIDDAVARHLAAEIPQGDEARSEPRGHRDRAGGGSSPAGRSASDAIQGRSIRPGEEARPDDPPGVRPPGGGRDQHRRPVVRARPDIARVLRRPQGRPRPAIAELLLLDSHPAVAPVEGGGQGAPLPGRQGHAGGEARHASPPRLLA